MKKRTRQIEELYADMKREVVDISINKLIISKDKKNVKYDPNYQRNYIWSNSKAINLIETIFINGVIPPLTVIETNNGLEIIDGRQRFETLLNFYNNVFPLRHFGLDKLPDLDGLYYNNLPHNLQQLFAEYKMKIILYSPNKFMFSDDIELIKRDLFKRSNFGMTALTPSEIARAKYLYDFLTIKFTSLFENDLEFYTNCINILLPKNKRELENRERMNLLLVAIRESLVMTYMPIIDSKTIRVGAAIYDKYYSTFVSPMNEKEKSQKYDEIIKILKKLHLVQLQLIKDNDGLKDNVQFFKCLFWMFSILYENFPNEFYGFDINQLCHYIKTSGYNYFSNYKNTTANDIEKRHLYVKNYLCDVLKLDISHYLKEVKYNPRLITYRHTSEFNVNEAWTKFGSTEQVMAVNDTMEVGEIISLIKQNRFVVRSDYQRAEVKSRKKASRIIESIILGVKLPPIYLYVVKGEDKLDRFTVLDGQQRLISILKFMGENITDSNYNYIKTYKKNYSLTGLKDLSGLNGQTYDGEENSLNPLKKTLIQNYKFDIVRIDEKANPNFDSVDMFLRLNQNPCPIRANSFEMWNSFDIIQTLDKIKEIAKFPLFKQTGNKMSEEELVTTLAYLDFLNINIDTIDDFFLTYLYLENSGKQFEHTEVKLSIKNKNKLTDFLEDLEPDSAEDLKFRSCLDDVNLFVDKLKILSSKDPNILLRIFNPNIAKPRKGNKKDFYITWLILRPLDLHVVETYKDAILKDLEKIFKTMKNMPESKDVDTFISYIKDIISKYSKFSNSDR